MSETTPTNAVFEKPKAVWVVGAWLSSVAAVVGTAFMNSFIYGGVYSLIVGLWGIYAVGKFWSRPRMIWLGVLAAWTLGMEWWWRGIEWIGRGVLDGAVQLIPVSYQAGVLMTIPMLIHSVIGGGLTGAVTRSRGAFWTCTCAALLMCGMIFDIAELSLALVIAWYAIVLGTFVAWAVHTRIKRLSGFCIWCGYDLRGTEGAVCPECGRARVTAAAPAV
jgi:hypothetical protein